MRVCFHELIFFAWRVPQRDVSRRLSKTAAALPLLSGSDLPPTETNETTQLAQLGFMTSYRCGPPVRGPWLSPHVRADVLTLPIAASAPCNVFIQPLSGIMTATSKVIWVYAKSLLVLKYWGRGCAGPWARHVDIWGPAGRADGPPLGFILIPTSRSHTLNMDVLFILRSKQSVLWHANCNQTQSSPTSHRIHASRDFLFFFSFLENTAVKSCFLP